MQIPGYYMTRPAQNDENTADFERIYYDMMAQDGAAEINYTLTAPKWQFLCYLAEKKNLLLHGSANAAIAEFEPRQSNDVDEFGNRCAIYAASDGLWPMYFAIVNRDVVTSLVNACFHVRSGDGHAAETYYYFSVNQAAFAQGPWQNGMIYLLPRDTFEQQIMEPYNGLAIESTQWASAVAVKPLAKLAVTPDDFPFLDQVNGHDPQLVSERAARNPDGFPWRE
ncbi:hypothetical protein [Alicyclobacillus fodiniaquatilis]|uniref:Uncharacterized protein n=1 Tax=Alicyclobacillus fodiniaquatilis TaxID=1661150 RepID=A0ABW4JIG2_9BACL